MPSAIRRRSPEELLQQLNAAVPIGTVRPTRRRRVGNVEEDYERGTYDLEFAAEGFVRQEVSVDLSHQAAQSLAIVLNFSS
jgi:hypothetical protein